MVGQVRIGHWVGQDRVRVALLNDLAAEVLTPEATEIELLSGSLGQFDRRHGTALGNLRDCYEHDRTLDLGQLDLDLLGRSVQCDAAEAGRGLDDLMAAIEEPYRRWVTGADATLDRDVAGLSNWSAAARRRAEPDLVRLQSRLNESASFETIHEHQEWLAGRRGGQPWVRGEPARSRARFERAEFGLSAPRSLFDEGIDPRGG